MRELAFRSTDINEFDILFQNLIGHNLGHKGYKPFKNTSPGYPVDLYYTDEALTIEIPVVGAQLENIKVVRTGDEINVSYHRERGTGHEDPKLNWINRGIVRRDFDFGWKISPKFNLKDMNTTLKNGLLTIIIPAEESQLPEEVTIVDLNKQ